MLCFWQDIPRLQLSGKKCIILCHRSLHAGSACDPRILQCLLLHRFSIFHTIGKAPVRRDCTIQLRTLSLGTVLLFFLIPKQFLQLLHTLGKLHKLFVVFLRFHQFLIPSALLFQQICHSLIFLMRIQMIGSEGILSFFQEINLTVQCLLLLQKFFFL